MPNILIVEDEKMIRTVLSSIIKDNNDSVEIFEAENGVVAIEIIKSEDLDLIISDIKMPKKDGVELLEYVSKEKLDIPVIMMSGHGDLEVAVDCMRKGAYDYISKPPDMNRLLGAVRNALDKKSILTENKKLKRKVSKKYEMIGVSKPIVEIKNMIDKVAQTTARVLITGPNGVGKELVAHWVHEKSDRNKKTLIEVNCAAIPSELIESELFGHEKGSFTGAHKQKKGKFEEANNGTLFLDEIGDMSLSAQAKVLRALQEGEITRVGGSKTIKVDVRVLAATNKDLKSEIEKGTFREDLYHRLAVILMKVPSLNDRREDIPELVKYFNIKISAELGTKPKRITEKVMKLLQEKNWTGNIRELRNAIERLTILCSHDEICVECVKNYILEK